jgi:hypothetical protein
MGTRTKGEERWEGRNPDVGMEVADVKVNMHVRTGDSISSKLGLSHVCVVVEGVFVERQAVFVEVIRS